MSIEQEYIYMDNNATTAAIPEAVEAMQQIAHLPHNPSSVHAFGRRAKAIIDDAKRQLALALNIHDDYRIIFTSCGTEANNLACSIDHDLLITSKIEHKSVLNRKNILLADVDQNGLIEVDALLDLIDAHYSKSRRILVSIMLANNDIGTIQPIHELNQLIKSRYANVIFHSDIIQAVGKMEVDIAKLGIDIATISGHKFGASTGVGAVIIKNDIANNMLNPIITGGGQEYNMRAWTHNTPAIAAIGVAASRISKRINDYQNVRVLLKYLRHKIRNICADAILYPNEDIDSLPNTVAIFMPGVKAETQVIFFDLHSIAISAGSACSSGKTEVSHVYQAITGDQNIAANIIRVSLAVDCTKEEINSFARIWERLYVMSNKSASA